MELPGPTRCQSIGIKDDSQSDFGVWIIEKLKETKSGQRLDDKKAIKNKICLKRFGLTTFISYKSTIADET